VARPRRVTGEAGEKLLAGPPSTFVDLDPTIEPIAVGVRLLRIYSPEPYKTDPLTFRDFGPLRRFDHQRPGKTGPGHDRGRGILYAAYELVCNVGERFGDEGAITKAGNRLARLAVTEALSVLDLRGPAATGARTIPAIGGAGERQVTQEWARWWYEHPQLAGIHGLLYASAHSGRDAIALWERANGKVAEDADWDLGDEQIRDDLELAANELHLPTL
jgi:hypothetical protein